MITAELYKYLIEQVGQAPAQLYALNHHHRNASCRHHDQAFARENTPHPVPKKPTSLVARLLQRQNITHVESTESKYWRHDKKRCGRLTEIALACSVPNSVEFWLSHESKFSPLAIHCTAQTEQEAKEHVAQVYRSKTGASQSCEVCILDETKDTLERQLKDAAVGRHIIVFFSQQHQTLIVLGEAVKTDTWKPAKRGPEDNKRHTALSPQLNHIIFAMSASKQSLVGASQLPPEVHLGTTEQAVKTQKHHARDLAEATLARAVPKSVQYWRQHHKKLIVQATSIKMDSEDVTKASLCASLHEIASYKKDLTLPYELCVLDAENDNLDERYKDFKENVTYQIVFVCRANNILIVLGKVQKNLPLTPISKTIKANMGGQLCTRSKLNAMIAASTQFPDIHLHLEASRSNTPQTREHIAGVLQRLGNADLPEKQQFYLGAIRHYATALLNSATTDNAAGILATLVHAQVLQWYQLLEHPTQPPSYKHCYEAFADLIEINHLAVSAKLIHRKSLSDVIRELLPDSVKELTGSMLFPYAMSAVSAVLQQVTNCDSPVVNCTEHQYYEIINKVTAHHDTTPLHHLADAATVPDLIITEFSAGNAATDNHQPIDIASSILTIASRHPSRHLRVLVDITMNTLTDQCLTTTLNALSPLLATGNLSLVLVQSFAKLVQLGGDVLPGGLCVELGQLKHRTITSRPAEYGLHATSACFANLLQWCHPRIQWYADRLRHNANYLYGCLAHELIENKLDNQQFVMQDNYDTKSPAVVLRMPVGLGTQHTDDTHIPLSASECIRQTLHERHNTLQLASFGFPGCNVTEIVTHHPSRAWVRINPGLENRDELDAMTKTLRDISEVWLKMHRLDRTTWLAVARKKTTHSMLDVTLTCLGGPMGMVDLPLTPCLYTNIDENQPHNQFLKLFDVHNSAPRVYVFLNREQKARYAADDPSDVRAHSSFEPHTVVCKAHPTAAEVVAEKMICSLFHISEFSIRPITARCIVMIHRILAKTPSAQRTSSLCVSHDHLECTLDMDQSFLRTCLLCFEDESPVIVAQTIISSAGAEVVIRDQKIHAITPLHADTTMLNPRIMLRLPGQQPTPIERMTGKQHAQLILKILRFHFSTEINDQVLVISFQGQRHNHAEELMTLPGGIESWLPHMREHDNTYDQLQWTGSLNIPQMVQLCAADLSPEDFNSTWRQANSMMRVLETRLRNDDWEVGDALAIQTALESMPKWLEEAVLSAIAYFVVEGTKQPLISLFATYEKKICRRINQWRINEILRNISTNPTHYNQQSIDIITDALLYMLATSRPYDDDRLAYYPSCMLDFRNTRVFNLLQLIADTHPSSKAADAWARSIKYSKHVITERCGNPAPSHQQIFNILQDCVHLAIQGWMPEELLAKAGKCLIANLESTKQALASHTYIDYTTFCMIPDLNPHEENMVVIDPDTDDGKRISSCLHRLGIFGHAQEAAEVWKALPEPSELVTERIEQNKDHRLGTLER